MRNTTKNQFSFHGDTLSVHVQKPSRYLGTEIHSVKKDLTSVDFHMALCFPDVYDVGMSHLGLKILYHILNLDTHSYAERAFAPWPDMEAALRRANRPLSSLETGTPLKHFDVVGFSLQYELCATSVLKMLELGGIPLKAEDRGPDDPIVLGGGPVAFNPVPLAPFFDAFAVGDGEELVVDLAAVYRKVRKGGGDRSAVLKAWAEVPGVFVPSLSDASTFVEKRIIADLDAAEFPTSLTTPFCEIVHDRIGVEISRGCTRGCRFCQAGMVYRPVRERSAKRVIDLACESVSSTGWEQVSLLSLSAGDHSQIAPIIHALMDEFVVSKTALSLPSMRTDSFDPELMARIAKVRGGGITLAPEAGTDRLRRIINKGNTAEDIEAAIKAASRDKRKSLKLYFMLGLPYEREDDLDGMAELILDASRWFKGRLTASISHFVPKAHTPFQWAPQISDEESMSRRERIKSRFRKGRERLKFHDSRMSMIEGVIARGDARISEVILRAHELGASFDGWDDHIKFDVWSRAFEDCGVDPESYHRGRNPDEKLPWDFIDSGVTQDYLREEWEKSAREATTPDCRHGCVGCGVCDFEEIRPRIALDEAPLPDIHRSILIEADETETCRFLLTYEKIGPMRLLGHHDVARLFERAFRRAKLSLAYSQGFHPHPKLRFSPPTAVGVESLCELLEFDLLNAPSAGEVEKRLSVQLPEGIVPSSLRELSLRDYALSSKIRRVIYRVKLGSGMDPSKLEAMAEAFRASDTFIVRKTLKGKTKEYDLKDLITDLQTETNGFVFSVKSGPEGSIHPFDATAALLNIDREEAKDAGITKIGISLPDSEG